MLTTYVHSGTFFGIIFMDEDNTFELQFEIHWGEKEVFTMILFLPVLQQLLFLVLPDTSQGWTAPVTCLTWDCILSDSIGWRIDQGIDAARQVWPFLLDDRGEDWSTNGVDTTKGIDNTTTTTTWLRNKMRAIAPYLGGLDSTASVEYALLARLLLEEQQLDPSIGMRGNYATKFHPQGPSKSIAIPSARSSRPLTVGEVQANWIDTLLDTVLVKYAIEKKNPVPILQKCIDGLETARPSLNSLVCDAIKKSVSKIVITVPTESEHSIATELLPHDSVAAMGSLGSSTCVVIGSEVEILKALLEQHSEVHFVCSNWAMMQRTRRLIHEYPGLSIALLPSSSTLSISQQNQAKMDPLLNLVTVDDMLELFSARIVKSSYMS